MTQRTAVLFMTHRWDHVMRLRFRRMQAEIGDRADVLILMQKSAVVAQAAADDPGVASAIYEFDADLLPEKLGYRYAFLDRIAPGSIHFPFLEFFRARPQYEHCFLIENDVEFSGNWGDFVSTTLASQPDFASFHFRPHAQISDWEWWRYLKPSPADSGWASDTANLWRSFNAIYCMSRRAADLVDTAHRSGWRCHQEAMLLTICLNNGCKTVDLAVASDFCVAKVPEGQRRMSVEFYPTVRFRPSVTKQEFHLRSTGHTLFHPVKGEWYFDGSRLVELDRPQTLSMSGVVLPYSPKTKS